MRSKLIPLKHCETSGINLACRNQKDLRSECICHSALWRTYLVHVNVVVVVTVINGFNEAFELTDSTAVDHQDESHSDGILHIGQAVVELANSLDLVR